MEGIIASLAGLDARSPLAPGHPLYPAISAVCRACSRLFRACLRSLCEDTSPSNAGRYRHADKRFF